MRATIDGKEYYLVPVEEESILDEYKVQDNASPIETGRIKDAVPVISDYRERYKQKKVKLSEITAPPKRYSKLDKASSSLDDYEYNGEKLFVGSGLQEEI